MERKKKSLFTVLVTIIVLMIVAIIYLSPMVVVRWTPEQVAEANNGIRYSSEGKNPSVEVIKGDYYWGTGEYAFEVYIDGCIYNSTDYELDEVDLVIYYECYNGSKIARLTLENVSPGKTSLEDVVIDTFRARYGYTTERDEFFVMYSQVTDAEINFPYERIENYIDPEEPPEYTNTICCLLVSLASLITFVCGILLVINIISAIRNRFLVEYVSTSFFEEKNEKTTNENIESQKLYCEYCGNEFSKPYDKCPCCGARFKNRKDKRKV